MQVSSERSKRRAKSRASVHPERVVEVGGDARAATGRPVRTCVACRAPGARGELLRVVEAPDGALAVDVRARMPGRGAWVHPTRACITTMAKRHAAERSLKVPVRDVDAEAVIEGVVVALRRKLASLVQIADRTGVLAIGTLLTTEWLGRQRVSLVLLASDAGDARRAVEGDEHADRLGGVEVRVYRTKAGLGELVGRGEVAMFAVADPSIAAEMTTTVDRLAGLEG